MTDAKIIKALECCKSVIGGNCDECPYVCCNMYEESDAIKDAIDLINRQKAEIEDLQNLMVKYNGDFAKQEAEIERLIRHTKMHDEIKAEAYKEFAERSEKELFIKQNKHREHWMETLNRHRGTEAYKDHEWSIDNWLRGYGEAVQDILSVNDNLLKELVGEDCEKTT